MARHEWEGISFLRFWSLGYVVILELVTPIWCSALKETSGEGYADFRGDPMSKVVPIWPFAAEYLSSVKPRVSRWRLGLQFAEGDPL